MKKLVTMMVVMALAGVAHADPLYEDFDTYGVENSPPGTYEAGAGVNTLPLSGLGGWVPFDEGGATDDVIIVDAWGPQHFTTYPGTGDNGLYWRSPRTTGYAGVAHAVGSLSPGDVISWTMNIPSAPPFLHFKIGSNLGDGNSGNNSGWLLDMGYAANNKIGYSGMTGNPYDAGAPGSWTEVELTLGAGLNTVDLRARNWTRQWNGDNPATSTVTNNADPSNAPWNVVGTFNTAGLIPATDAWIAFAGESPNSGSAYQHGIAIDQVNITPEPVTMALLGLGGLAVLRRRRRS